MSSSRYPDSRYVRDRSPFRDRRQSTYGSTYPPRASDSGPRSNADANGFPPRDTPRGPKSLVDAPRGPPAGGPSGAPSAPRDGRGRGFAGRGEVPSLRDAPPLSSVPHPHPPHNSWRASDRDRDRDFDRDRRDRRPSPPRRSPVRDSRDSRDSRDQRDFPPRDLDIARARRNSRDGPPSAGSTYSDPPLNTGSSYRGSGFGRGRGGRDFHGEGRGRGRPMYPDDRDRHHDARDRMPDRSYRPRSRSRDPVRRERDLRDERDRDFDRRERDDRRFVPREYDSYIGPAGAKPGPRALDTHRGSTTLDSRHLPGTPTGAAPHSTHHSPADRHGPPVDSYARRPSVATEALGNKDARREPGRDDLLLAGRAEASRERYAPRASSPPAAVPAFGSNVWRNPLLDSKPTTASQPPKPSPPTPSTVAQAAPAVTAPPPPPPPPTAPKSNVPAGLSTAPPTGPKADRPSERPPVDVQSQSQGLSQALDPKTGLPEQSRMEPRQSLAPPIHSNNGPPASNSEAKPSVPATHNTSTSAISPPVGPAATSRAPPTGPQAALRANVSPSFPRPARLPYPSNPRDPSPSAGPPSIASRNGSGSGPTMMLSNTSPKTLPANIPTGPKADRGNPMGVRPPMYPPPDRSGFQPNRMSMNGQPKSMQWVRPGLNLNNRPTVPTKREFPVEDRDRSFGTAPKAPRLEASGSAPESQRAEHTKSESPSMARPTAEMDLSHNRRASGEHRRADSPKPMPIETRRPSNVSMTDAPPAMEKPPKSAASSAPEVLQDSDDDLDLDEDDFAESEAKYNREKALLESKRIDLSASHFRATSPLQEIILLSTLTAAHLPREETKPVEEEPSFVPSPKMSPVIPQESTMNELPTPKEEEAEDIDMEYKEEEDKQQLAPATRALRLRRSTGDEDEEAPDLSSLPFLGSGPPTPVSELEAPRVSDTVMLAIRDKLRKSIEPELDTEKLLEEYAATYRNWRMHVHILDTVKDTDSNERSASVEPSVRVTTPGIDSLTAGPILDNPAPTTGRRGHASRWATEFDLELAMQESLRTAELEREQHEKEPKKSWADPEKEADVPAELSDYELQRRKFIDTNFQREPGQGIFAFHYEPPEDDFTEDEHRIMVQQYRDQYAKKWGKLAEILYKEAGTSRTYKDCINHYYATKWQREYKGKVRRRGVGARKKGAGRGRGAIANMERPDPSGEEGLAPALTETGRPRRSAAPTFGAETDLDTATSTPASGRVRRQTDTDGTQEKAGRRGKATKEKGGRKTKAQPIAAAPAGSPVKVDRKTLGVKMEDEFAKAGEMPLPIQPGIQEEPMMLQAEPQYHPIIGMTDRPRLQPSSARPGPSSYWSVTEQTDFQKNVAHFGTDWAAIATHMGTKTQTMVKNQYLRLVEGGAKDLEKAAEEADERRNRGVDLGLPPIPTPAPKRRYESTQVAAPRTLAPTPEAQPGYPMGVSKGSPPSVPSGSRFPSMGQTPQPKPMVPGTPYTMQDSSLVSIPQPQQSPPTHTVRPPVHHLPQLDSRRPGPRAGFFSDEPQRGMEHRPPSQSSSLPPSSRSVQNHGQTQMHAQPSLFRPSFQEREPPRPESQQDRYQPQHARHMSGEVHHGRPFGSGAVPSRPGTGAGSPENRSLPYQHRHQSSLIETAVPPPVSMSPAQHMPPRVTHAATPIKEESRQHSVSHLQAQSQPPMHMQAHHPYMPSVQPPPVSAPSAPSAPKPTPEPRKSNLMSLLNDDQPEEPKKKKPIEQNVPSHTPTPQQQNPIAPPPVSQPPLQRRDPYVEAPTQTTYGRVPYAQQQPGMAQVPVRQVVDLTREQASAGRPQRDDWQRQYPGHSQAPQAPSTNSPRAGISQPNYADRTAFLGNHRSLLAQHNQPRHNPSPPPLAFSNSPHMHSRTPSLSGPPGQQSRHGMNAPTASHLAQAPTVSSQILQPNPYAQVDPPNGPQSSGPVGMRPSPHLHTSHVGGQRDVHSRNEHSQVHNGNMAYSNPQTPNEQHSGPQHSRGPSMADQFRRDPRDVHHDFDPRTGDRDMSREIQHRADALLREREPMMSRSVGPPPSHQDPRYQPPQQDRPFGGPQRSHTPLSRSDHGPPPLQHPPRSSLGDSHTLYGGHPRAEERFRDPFARENDRLREEQAQREDYFAGHRDRERREREFHELRERDAQMQRERMMVRGPPQGPPPEQRGTPGPPQQQGPGGMDWANAVPRQHGGEWRR